jgi:hypothetical protein
MWYTIFIVLATREAQGPNCCASQCSNDRTVSRLALMTASTSPPLLDATPIGFLVLE